MSESMIERVARAIQPAIERDNDIYWAAEYGRPIAKASVETIARAAIAAMMQPNPAMEAAGAIEYDEPIVVIWQAMLRAALSPNAAEEYVSCRS